MVPRDLGCQRPACQASNRGRYPSDVCRYPTAHRRPELDRSMPNSACSPDRGAMGMRVQAPSRIASAMGDRGASGPAAVMPTAHAWLPARVTDVSRVRVHVRAMGRGAHAAGPATCSATDAPRTAEPVAERAAKVPGVGLARHSTSARPRTRDRVKIVGTATDSTRPGHSGWRGSGGGSPTGLYSSVPMEYMDSVLDLVGGTP